MNIFIGNIAYIIYWLAYAMILQQCYQNMRWFDMLMESEGGLLWQYDNNQSSSSNNWKPSIQHISNKWFRAGRLYRLTISFAQVNNSHFWWHENIHSESLEETLCIIALWYSIFIPFESWLYIQYSLIVIFSCIEKVNSWLSLFDVVEIPIQKYGQVQRLIRISFILLMFPRVVKILVD